MKLIDSGGVGRGRRLGSLAEGGVPLADEPPLELRIRLGAVCGRHFVELLEQALIATGEACQGVADGHLLGALSAVGLAVVRVADES